MFMSSLEIWNENSVLQASAAAAMILVVFIRVRRKRRKVDNEKKTLT